MKRSLRVGRRDWVGAAAGALLVLYAFMEDMAAVLMRGGAEAVLSFVPTAFDWPMFLAGYALMAWVAGRVLFRSA